MKSGKGAEIWVFYNRFFPFDLTAKDLQQLDLKPDDAQHEDFQMIATSLDPPVMQISDLKIDKVGKSEPRAISLSLSYKLLHEPPDEMNFMCALMSGPEAALPAGAKASLQFNNLPTGKLTNAGKVHLQFRMADGSEGKRTSFPIFIGYFTDTMQLGSNVLSTTLQIPEP